MTDLTCGSLFSGIGGIDLAFQQAGFTISYQVEIDDYCQKVLAKHWPEVQRYGDIFGIDALPPVDIMAGGFPCQPVSHAGQRRGEQDERWLWPEFYRLIQQSQPRVVFLENVPGLRTIDGGATFKRVVGQLAEIGYTVQWSHCRAADIGAPHKRERVFIVAYHQNSGVNGRQRSSAVVAQSCTTNRASQRTVDNGGAKTLGYAIRTGLERRQGFRSHTRTQQPPVKRTDHYAGQKTDAQPHLGRGTDGLSYRLDGHQFPAPPGEQYAWEPPRTTSEIENRTNRIKALGNAVVPQVVYPIALAIHEWLTND